MKNIIVSAVYFCSLCSLSATVERMAPNNWWVGMKEPTFQVLLYGDDLKEKTVSLAYEGVTLDQVVRVENPNYLFLYLKIEPGTAPGALPIRLEEGDRKSTRLNSSHYS